MLAHLLLVAALSVPSLPRPEGEEVDYTFTEVSVVTMEPAHGDEPRSLADRNVVIRGGRIAAIEAGSDRPAAGTRRIDGRGKTLLPGLVDMHSHLLSDDRIADAYAPDELAVILANGVTTIRNPIGKPEHLAYRGALASGELLGPALYVGSPQLAGRRWGEVWNGFVITSPDEARTAVRASRDAGYDFIKLTFDLTLDEYEAAVDEAARLGLPVIGHVGAPVGLRRALAARQQIEHLDEYLEALLPADAPVDCSVSGTNVWRRPCWDSLAWLDAERIDDVVQATLTAGIYNTPTLVFLNTSFGTGRTDEELEQSPDWRFVSPEVRGDLLMGRKQFWNDPPPAAQRRRFVELRQRLTKALHAAGAKLMAGSDSPEWLLLYGFTLHRELAALVDAGLEPWDALETATRNPAEFLGATDEFGRVAVGLRADLVLLDASPLDDIANTKAIAGVMRRGRWLPRAELDALLDASAESLGAAPLR